VSSVTRRTASQAPRRAAVEADLLRAAEDLLGEGRSYTELSVEQIAARAGISRSAFYFYFQDKRELLLRVVDNVAELFYAHADGWWSARTQADRDLHDPTKLKETLGAVLALWREHAPLLTAIVETGGYDEEVAEFWRGINHRFVERTREHIEAEQAAGRANDLPAGTTAFALVWMTERVWYQHVARSPEVSDDELIEALAGVIWNSVYGHSAATPTPERALNVEG
jgi:TetR/AcrR family transcriptional regulator, ethionamide resistance regulator